MLAIHRWSCQQADLGITSISVDDIWVETCAIMEEDRANSSADSRKITQAVSPPSGPSSRNVEDEELHARIDTQAESNQPQDPTIPQKSDSFEGRATHGAEKGRDQVSDYLHSRSILSLPRPRTIWKTG